MYENWSSMSSFRPFRSNLKKVASLTIFWSGAVQLSNFVSAALAFKRNSTLANRSCDKNVQAEIGSSITFHCDVNCSSDNLTQWFYSNSSNNRHTKIVHNGLSLRPEWSSTGIVVNHSQTVDHSVLKITHITQNSSGVYECSINNGEESGCRKGFCLTTGEHSHCCLYSQIDRYKSYFTGASFFSWGGGLIS